MSQLPDGRSPLSRTVVPLLAAAVLVGLVLMLPHRDAQPVMTADPLDLAPLELDEPPTWAQQRGKDEVLRNLDRLDWGGHAALAASQRALELHRGQLAPEVLSRLRAIGDGHPVLAERLIALLGTEDPATPGLVDEVVRRALSTHALESKAALRVLAHLPDRRALDGILPRLIDADEGVRSFARGALAQRARDGDVEAQSVIISELEGQPQDPDLAYLTVLQDFQDPATVRALLHSIAKQAGGAARMVAFTALLAHDDPLARQYFDMLLASNDASTRLDAWRGLSVARKVGGRSRWKELIGSVSPMEAAAIAQVLTVAVDTDQPEKAEALDLLLALAADRTNAVHEAVLGALYARHHPWAVETTRQELQSEVGTQLLLTVERIISGPKDLTPELASVALERLAQPTLRDDDRALLCRLVAHVAPERAADVVVQFALDAPAKAPSLATQAIALLSDLGAHGIERLSRELGTPQGRALFIRAAADSGSAAALPGLQLIMLDPATDDVQRRAALDALARVSDGPREEVLRRVAEQFTDPGLKQRARLLFWNYM